MPRSHQEHRDSDSSSCGCSSAIQISCCGARSGYVGPWTTAVVLYAKVTETAQTGTKMQRQLVGNGWRMVKYIVAQSALRSAPWFLREFAELKQ